MGKDARARVLGDTQAKAIGRMLRTSPRKLNLVAQSIRGKKAEVALNELTFSPKRIAKAVKKVLQSVISRFPRAAEIMRSQHASVGTQSEPRFRPTHSPSKCMCYQRPTAK